MSDKTEEPTPRRLRRAIAEGDVPISAALVAAAAFFAASWAILPASDRVASWASTALRHAISDALAADALGRLSHDALWAMVVLSVPPLAAAALVAAIVGALQARGSFSLRRLSPTLSNLDLAKGLRAIVSAQRGVGVIAALATTLFVALLAFHFVTQNFASLAATIAAPAKALRLAGALAMRLTRAVALVLLAAACLDVLQTRKAWRARLRMSKEEIKREAREAEGDPEIKAARERAHHELASQTSLTMIADAALVVEGVHVAAALRYRDGASDIPQLIAKGEGVVARQMVEAAASYAVAITRADALAKALYVLDVGATLPEALYDEVAEALRSSGWQPSPSDD